MDQNTSGKDICEWEWLKAIWTEKRWKKEEHKCPLYSCYYGDRCIWGCLAQCTASTIKSTQTHLMVGSLAIPTDIDSIFYSHIMQVKWTFPGRNFILFLSWIIFYEEDQMAWEQVSLAQLCRASLQTESPRPGGRSQPVSFVMIHPCRR